MKSNLSDVQQRVNRYWYTDGLAEILGGGMFLLLAVYFALQDFLGPDSMLSGLLQASLALLMIGGAFVSRRLINSLKTRLTYPRTGYVEYRVNKKDTGRKRILVFILAFTISALTIAFVGIFKSFDSIVAVTGFIVGMILVLLRGKASGLFRFYVLGAISLLLGFAISASGLSEGYALGLYYGLMGVCFLISGGLTLTHYLHENPLPAEGQSGQ
jgi:MFS family permease